MKMASMSKRACPPTNQPHNDIVETPVEIARYMIKQHAHVMSEWIDPCMGSGVFYNNFPHYVNADWREISLGRDFLIDDYLYADMCISNPPWSKIPSFIEKCRFMQNVVFLMPITNIVTRARLRLLRELSFYIASFTLFETPVEWTQSGFQLASVHLQKIPCDTKWTVAKNVYNERNAP
jgi:hypothetical protein